MLETLEIELMRSIRHLEEAIKLGDTLLVNLNTAIKDFSEKRAELLISQAVLRKKLADAKEILEPAL